MSSEGKIHRVKNVEEANDMIVIRPEPDPNLLQLAGMAMQGYISNSVEGPLMTQEDVVAESFDIAEWMLEEYKKRESKGEKNG